MDVYETYAYGSEIVGPSKSTEKAFLLGAKDKPTARRPMWQYRWCGQETGEGEIEISSDREVQTITFSKKGEELLESSSVVSLANMNSPEERSALLNGHRILMLKVSRIMYAARRLMSMQELQGGISLHVLPYQMIGDTPGCWIVL
jgi:hypothetical protein